MILFKLKLAFRNLLKNKLYSALIIGGFAIGFTASILIALYYNAEHNVDKDFANYKNIYRLYDAKKKESGLDYKLNAILNEKYPDIKIACPLGLSYYPNTIKAPDINNYIRVKYIVSTNNSFFDVFSIPILTKTGNKPFSQINSAVISESMAKKLFGDKNPLGQTLQEEFYSATVTAVMKDLPENSSFKAELLLNSDNKKFQMAQMCDSNNVCIYPVEHFLLLKNDVSPKLLTKKINKTIKEYNTTTDSLALQSLSDIYLSSEKLGWTDDHFRGNSKMLLIFLAIAILIILLSSINFLNYTVSMQYAKMKEIGIYKTNGAGRMQLLTNSILEVSLGIFIALLFALLLTWLILPYSNVIFGRDIHLSDINIPQLLPIFIGTILGIILLNSLAPIYVLSRFNITDFLSGTRKRNGKQVGKQIMLIFQSTVSIALIATVITVYKQLNFVEHHDLGFDQEHLVRIEIPFLFKNSESLKQEMESMPFVKTASLSNGYPGNINLTLGSGTKDEFMVSCITVSDDYLKTMGIHLLEGRDFLSGDQDKVCLINEAAKQKYGWKSSEGQHFKSGKEGGYEVIGTVNDFNVTSLKSAMAPVALIYNPKRNFNALSIRLMPGDVGQQMEQLRKTWKRFLPNDPMEFTFYDKQFQSMYEKEEKLGKSITFFSLIAIVLTCMGILGQIFLISLSRTKEIGIRKVNGAKISEIMLMLNKDFVKWVTIAFIIATPVSYYAMNKWLENFAYKTTLSWWIFALAGVLALGIALLTVSWQSWRAATRNPVEALRYE